MSDTPSPAEFANLHVDAIRTGNIYAELLSSEYYHRGRLETAFDRDETLAKIRQRQQQSMWARGVFIASIEALVAAGGGAEASSILVSVHDRTSRAMQPEAITKESTRC